MIFQETWQKVLNGIKTRTCRIKRAGEIAYIGKQSNEIIAVGKNIDDICDVIFFDDRRWYYNTNALYQSFNLLNPRYGVNCQYAVQPGRGKPAIWWRWCDNNRWVYPTPIERRYDFESETEIRIDHRPELPKAGYKPLRICVTHIRQEDVRHISHEDALAEGFSNRTEFWHTWTYLHDPKAATLMSNYIDLTIWDDWKFFYDEILSKRPAKLYQAWVLTFEVAE